MSRRNEPSIRPMSGVDCAWLRMDDPTNLMIINGVMMFDRPLSPERVRAVLADRLARMPRFRDRAVELGWLRWGWRRDAGFDVDRHFEVDPLPAPGGEAELAEYVSDRMNVALPFDRPLWRVHLVQGYGEGSALLWRLHHCIGDGIALMVLLLALTDLEPEAHDRRDGSGLWGNDNPLSDLFGDVRLHPDDAYQHLEELMPEGARLLAKPAETLGALNPWLLRAASVPSFLRLAGRWPDPRTPLKGALTTGKRVAWSAPIPLARFQVVRQGLGATLNDVVLNALAGGLRRYLRDEGFETRDLDVRAVVPVSLRPVAEMAELGNQFGLIFLSLPLGIADPRERMTELRRRMKKLKRSVEPWVTYKVLGIIGRLPKLVQNLVIRIFGTKGTAVVTSVPGPSRELYLAGEAIRGIAFWVPQSGRLGLGVSIISYAGALRLGVASDAGVVADPSRIVKAFEEELGAV